MPPGKFPLRGRTPGNLLLEIAQASDGTADVFKTWAAFRHNPSHRLIVAGDDYLFAAGDPIQKFTKSGLGVKSGYSCHGAKLTGH
jgi:hypothetical protein